MALDEDYRSFRDHLSTSEWADLLRIGGPFRFRPGATLLNEGEDGDHVFVLTAGLCRVVGARADHGQSLLALRAAGDTIGEQSGIDKRPRSASVHAVVECRGQRLRGPEFTAFIRRRRLDAQLTSYLSMKLRSNGSMISELSRSSARSKVAWLLHRLTATTGQDDFVPLPQRDLADLLGLARSSVAASLAEFRALGLLRTEQGGVHVLDPAALLDEIHRSR
ncbi:Crp/Fnr family transcriptional regulator [Saccharopolyspora sp. NPDC047091]|uniref:Crp/Fnr family transcriptional regulator n=1 Tax=Saccharopolyspora sp. NPDC047091 TaxID=3155924 RepID=UPI0033C748FE